MITKSNSEIITRIISFSFSQRRININPTVGYQKLREPLADIQIWDDKEIEQFLNFANLKYPVRTKKRWVYIVYLAMLETAVRANELWGLFKKDIPTQGSKLKISRQYLGKNKYGVPKGKISRYVPFSPRLRFEIEDWLKYFDDESKTLFSTSTGTPIDHDNFVKRIFQEDLTESKIRVIRFHDLRHTAITRFLRLRVRVEVVQKIAGHKDLKTTQRYVHILGMDIEDVGNELNFSISQSHKVPLQIA